jgi:hypothetical protein
MNKWILNTIGILLIPTVLVLIWALVQVGKTAQSVSTTISSASSVITNLATTTASLNTTLAIVNQPCGAKDKNGLLLKNGTLCSIDKTVVKIGDIAVTTQLQVAQTDRLITSAVTSVSNTTQHLNLTADAATTAINSGNQLIVTANNGLEPILTNANGGLEDIRAEIKSDAVQGATKDFARLLKSSADIAENSAGITADGKKVSDYYTKQLLTPKSFLQKVEGYSGDLFDMGAYLARHYR